MSIRYYDRQGRPMDRYPTEDDERYKRVNETTLPNGLWVSTVWLGLDHRCGDEGPPIVFESMVFPSRDNLSELAVRRYATELEAAVGHEVLCEQWTKVSQEDLAAGRTPEREADEAAPGAQG